MKTLQYYFHIFSIFYFYLFLSNFSPAAVTRQKRSAVQINIWNFSSI